MRKLMLVLLLVASCGNDNPAQWAIDLPLTGTFPTGQVACGPYELPRMTLTVLDPLGMPTIAEDGEVWSCVTLPNDTVNCEQDAPQAASTLDIKPTHVMYRLDFRDGTGCVFHFGEGDPF